MKRHEINLLWKKVSASSWLIAKILLRCAVSKTSKFVIIFCVMGDSLFSPTWDRPKPQMVLSYVPKVCYCPQIPVNFVHIIMRFGVLLALWDPASPSTRHLTTTRDVHATMQCTGVSFNCVSYLSAATHLALTNYCSHSFIPWAQYHV